MSVRWTAGLLGVALAVGAGCSSGGAGGGGVVTGDGGGVTGMDGSRPDGGGGANCGAATSCGACTPMAGCGWCGRTGRCVAGGSTASTDMSCSGADWAWLPSRCGGDGGVLPPVDAAAQCATATNCGACTAMGACGWCGRTGRCLQGTSTGSLDMACGSPDWAWTSSRCGGDGGVLPPRDAGPSCTGVPRSCGLTIAGGVRTCTAGQMVTIGCNSGCTPALGMCTGDAVMQICPSSATTTVCSGMAVIASNDDAPSTAMCRGEAGTGLCPVTTFMCPSNGQYTVWTGAYDAEETATCVPAVR